MSGGLGSSERVEVAAGGGGGEWRAAAAARPPNPRRQAGRAGSGSACTRLSVQKALQATDSSCVAHRGSRRAVGDSDAWKSEQKTNVPAHGSKAGRCCKSCLCTTKGHTSIATEVKVAGNNAPASSAFMSTAAGGWANVATPRGGILTAVKPAVPPILRCPTGRHLLNF